MVMQIQNIFSATMKTSQLSKLNKVNKLAKSEADNNRIQENDNKILNNLKKEEKLNTAYNSIGLGNFLNTTA